MNKLSDLELELIKKIAKIEGKTFVNYFGDPFVQNGIALTPYNPFVQNGITLTIYNLLTDKAMLWDLRLKYKVEIDDDCKTCRIWVIPGGDCFVVDYETDEDLPRAMLEVIEEANNG